ncbi:hypothetical protein tb265_32320 [Gemmatimonadetes bacterium T265]|nr:hypothetical protein tb265_32320 [Gemmatimonadetes bacterium T265]
MKIPSSWLVGGGAAALWFRERAGRQSAERLAAATLEALLNAIDANDAMTGAHVRRTAAYSLILARAAGLNEPCRRSVERVALFHDIGKIHEALFDIVHDDAKLTPEERDAVATHPQRGADVLAPLAGFYPELADGVLSHHERWDGTGYPRKLRGDAIPLEARVVAIADTFDALTHSRRYHEGESAHRGTAVIAEGRGTQFDPALVDLFLSPPVFECVEQQMQANRPKPTVERPQDQERRTRERESDVPDVRFRWRTAQPAS